MANVTYVLGAGASCEALPMVDNFVKEISEVLEQLRSMDANINYTDALRAPFDRVREDLIFLLQGCASHQSVDTFAKMFFLTKSWKEYRRVKCSIVLFFDLYYYYNKKKVDKRYDAFIASILNTEEPRLPQHINIISWNYDYEIEKAYLKYIKGIDQISQVYHELNVIHKDQPTDARRDRFRIIKINGTAGYWKEEQALTLGLGTNALTSSDSPGDPSNISPLLRNHEAWSRGAGLIEPAISFAWEEKNRERIVDEAKRIINLSDSIVVIGYSFPYFNRMVDRDLFRKKDIGPFKLAHIYVQDPSANDVIESMKGLNKDNEWGDTQFHPIKNTKQFYMPHEMD